MAGHTIMFDVHTVADCQQGIKWCIYSLRYNDKRMGCRKAA